MAVNVPTQCASSEREQLQAIAAKHSTWWMRAMQSCNVGVYIGGSAPKNLNFSQAPPDKPKDVPQQMLTQGTDDDKQRTDAQKSCSKDVNIQDQRLQEEHEKLKREAEQLRKEAERRANECQDLRAHTENLQAAHQALEQEHREMTKKRDAMVGKYGEMAQKHDEMAQKFDEMVQKHDEMAQQKEEAETRAVLLATKDTQVEGGNGQAMQNQQDITQLQTELQLMAAMNEKLQDELNVVSQEATQLQDQNVALEDDNATCSRKVAELEQRCNDLLEENQNFYALQAEHNHLQDQHAVLADNNNFLMSQVDENKSYSQDLTKRLAEMQARVIELEEMGERAPALDQANADGEKVQMQLQLYEANQRYQEELVRSQELERRHAELDQHFQMQEQRHQDEISNLEGHFQAQSRELQSANTDLEPQLQMQAQSQGFARTIAELEMQIQIQERRHQEEISNLEAQFEVRSRDIERLNADLERQIQMQEIEHQEGIRELETRLRAQVPSREQADAEWQQQLEVQHKLHMEERAHLEQKIQGHLAVHDRQLESLESLEKELEQERLRAGQLAAERGMLQANFEAVDSNCRALEQQCGHLEVQVKQHQGQSAGRHQLEADQLAMQAEYDRLRADHSLLANENAGLANQCDQLRAEHSMLAEQHSGISAEAHWHRECVDQLTAERDVLQANCDRLTAEHNVLADEHQALVAQAEQLRAEASALDSAGREAFCQAEDLRQKTAEQDGQLTAYEAEIQKLHAEKDSIFLQSQAEIQKLRSENDKLSGKLQGQTLRVYSADNPPQLESQVIRRVVEDPLARTREPAEIVVQASLYSPDKIIRRTGEAVDSNVATTPTEWRQMNSTPSKPRDYPTTKVLPVRAAPSAASPPLLSSSTMVATSFSQPLQMASSARVTGRITTAEPVTRPVRTTPWASSYASSAVVSPASVTPLDGSLRELNRARVLQAPIGATSVSASMSSGIVTRTLVP